MYKFILLMVCMMFPGGNADVKDLQETIPHDVSAWESSPIEDKLDTDTIDIIQSTKLKQDFKVTPGDQRLKVTFLQLFTKLARKMMHPGKLVRITSMVFLWIPQSNNMSGKLTLTLVDNRKPKDDKARIESQVAFSPNKMTLGVFYHNYAVSLDDLQYFDLEFYKHGVNMIQGTMGRLSFGYKTIMTGPSYYRKKQPEVFYLPITEVPELSVETPTDIYKQYISKMKNKKNKEIDYFQKMSTFVADAVTPINEISSLNEDRLADYEENYRIIMKYHDDAKRVPHLREKMSELDAAIVSVKSKIEICKDEIQKKKLIEIPDRVNEYNQDEYIRAKLNM